MREDRLVCDVLNVRFVWLLVVFATDFLDNVTVGERKERFGGLHGLSVRQARCQCETLWGIVAVRSDNAGRSGETRGDEIGKVMLCYVCDCSESDSFSFILKSNAEPAVNRLESLGNIMPRAHI